MRKSFYILLMVSLFLAISLNGCGTPTAAPNQGFVENFESYNITAPNPWTPMNGWTSTTADVWSITDNGFTGKGLKLIKHGVDSFLLHDYNGTDTTISLKVKSLAVTGFQRIGIVGRYTKINNDPCYYVLYLGDYYGSGDSVWLQLAKHYCETSDYGLASVQFLQSNLDTSTFYTLTLQISGNDPVTINGTVTDGISTKTVSFIDDGTIHEAVIKNGQIGIGAIYVINDDPIIFDDFKAAIPQK